MGLLKSLFKFLSPKYQNVFLDYPVNPRPRFGHGKPPHPKLHSIVDSNRSKYAKILKASLNYMDDIKQIPRHPSKDNPTDPYWQNGFLPGLDVIMLYTMLAEIRPKTYLEVGSGHSTRVAHRSRMDNDIDMKIMSIDPEPRASIQGIVDKMIPSRLESSDYSIFSTVESGDIVFIDNSHRILPNSDSTVFFLEILPELPPGVIVHIHDVYLPYDYPQFMCDRYYSEQYGLAINLLANSSRYRTILPNYFISLDPELAAIVSPYWDLPELQGVERHGGSFWIEIGN